jgi:hypothetical protein
MRLKYAKRLHNGDQVVLKTDKANPCKVLQSYQDPNYPKVWVLEILSPTAGWMCVGHKEVQ